MRKNKYLITGLTLLMVVATLFLMAPAATNASIYPFCRFYGPVSLYGNNVPVGSTVMAWIEGSKGGPWTAQTTGIDSQYSIDVPQNTGGVDKNGGVNGDIVHFAVSVNGSLMPDTSTGTWNWADTIYHRISAINGGPGPSNLTIATTELPRWACEQFPADPPASWLPLPPPGWIIGQPYSAALTASGGNGNLTWSASNLPPGLSISTDGTISGTPTEAGTYDIAISVHDSAIPPATATTDLILKIYLAGDAKGDGSVSIADVTYVERAILGLSPPTAGCDANLSGSISIADVTKVERIILGLP